MVNSPIAEFYAGRSVFITGATGFCGKVLVEKLLRSCPDVKHIYVLLRTKKGLNARARLEQLMDTVIFDDVKKKNPRAAGKVIPIAGDMTLEGLGISDTDLEMMKSQVSVVFHSAATVKFNEPIKQSVEFNLVGTRRVIQMCQKLDNLAALIHVSTAYANCDREVISEQVYPSPAPPSDLIESVKWLPEETLERLTGELLGKRPNTYTYTKALAETLLAEEAGALPVAIVRPSIVTAAWREPLPGWVDNLNGPTGLIIAAGKGILRSVLVTSEAIADLVPVDSVINVMITASWCTATRPPLSNDITVYHVTSGELNPIRWGFIEEITFPLFSKYPSMEIFRFPGGSFRSTRFAHSVAVFFEHHVPAFIADSIAAILGKKQIMRQVYEKLHKATKTLECFTTNQWLFKSDNILKLGEQLEGDDKQTFAFDIRQLDWVTYWDSYVLGSRRYVLKEDDSSLPVARESLKRHQLIQRVVQFFLMLAALNFFVFSARDVCTSCITLCTKACNFITSVIASPFRSPPSMVKT